MRREPPQSEPLPSLGEGSQKPRIWQDAKRPGEGERIVIVKEGFVKRIWYDLAKFTLDRTKIETLNLTSLYLGV
jgi:hypothetical protein